MEKSFDEFKAEFKREKDVDLTEITIYTTSGKHFFFSGVDAQTVYEAINKASVRGAEWTIPFKLENGKTGIFDMNSIVYFTFK